MGEQHLFGVALALWGLREVYGLFKDRANKTSSKLDEVLVMLTELRTDYREMKDRTLKDLKAAHDRIRALEGKSDRPRPRR